MEGQIHTMEGQIHAKYYPMIGVCGTIILKRFAHIGNVYYDLTLDMAICKPGIKLCKSGAAASTDYGSAGSRRGTKRGAKMNGNAWGNGHPDYGKWFPYGETPNGEFSSKGGCRFSAASSQGAERSGEREPTPPKRKCRRKQKKSKTENSHNEQPAYYSPTSPTSSSSSCPSPDKGQCPQPHNYSYRSYKPSPPTYDPTAPGYEPNSTAYSPPEDTLPSFDEPEPAFYIPSSSYERPTSASYSPATPVYSAPSVDKNQFAPGYMPSSPSNSFAEHTHHEMPIYIPPRPSASPISPSYSPTTHRISVQEPQYNPTNMNQRPTYTPPKAAPPSPEKYF